MCWRRESVARAFLQSRAGVQRSRSLAAERRAGKYFPWMSRVGMPGTYNLYQDLGWEEDMSDKTAMPLEPEGHAARRQFLKRCGRFAVVTPPAMTMLLEVAAVPSEAHASTIGHWRGYSTGGNSQGGDGNSQR